MLSYALANPLGTLNSNIPYNTIYKLEEYSVSTMLNLRMCVYCLMKASPII